MIGLRWCGLAAAIALAAALVEPLPAAACSPGSCVDGAFSIPSGATIPANTPAFVWLRAHDYSRRLAPPSMLLRLTRIDDGSNAAVPFGTRPLAQSDDELLVRPEEELVPGARYRLEVEAEASETGCMTEAIEFEAGAVAELPERLGQAKLSTPKRLEVDVATVSGSCDTPLSAVAAKLELELSAEAKPWAPLFLYTTKVDGRVWAPSWSLGPYGPDYENGEDLLFAECPGELKSGRAVDKGAYHDGLDEGSYDVRIEALLPGVEGVLTSDSAPLALDCGASDSCTVSAPGRPRRPLWPLALAAAFVARAVVRGRKPRRR